MCTAVCRRVIDWLKLVDFFFHVCLFYSRHGCRRSRLHWLIIVGRLFTFVCLFVLFFCLCVMYCRNVLDHHVKCKKKQCVLTVRIFVFSPHVRSSVVVMVICWLIDFFFFVCPPRAPFNRFFFCTTCQRGAPYDPRWRTFFPVKWVFAKDLPNQQLGHITLPDHNNKPVAAAKDAQV